MTARKIPIKWAIAPHTTAKHQILEEYLKAWFPIIARWNKDIVYIDGFAGPGRYSGGEFGSPIIALNAIKNHTMLGSARSINFLFIEKDKKRSSALRQTLQEEFSSGMPSNIQYDVLDSDFEGGLSSILDTQDEQNKKLAPTFAFIDPFGYSDFSMDLIQRLLSYDKCEVFITFMASYVHRFSDPLHVKSQFELFGTEELPDFSDGKNTNEKINSILDFYIKQLQKNGGAKYVYPFQMIGDKNIPIYYLIFATNHLKGLEEMKKAMTKVDSRGLYSFSDRIGSSQIFFAGIKDDESRIARDAELVLKHFAGKTVSVEKIHEFVITDTPHLSEKRLLKFLESKKPPQIHVTDRKRILSYPDGCVVEFVG